MVQAASDIRVTSEVTVMNGIIFVKYVGKKTFIEIKFILTENFCDPYFTILPSEAAYGLF
jgi:hypothetical protein